MGAPHFRSVPRYKGAVSTSVVVSEETTSGGRESVMTLKTTISHVDTERPEFIYYLLNFLVNFWVNFYLNILLC